MGTLSSELRIVIEEADPGPRVYADANIPNGVVAFMRDVLKWDVFFVLEHDDLRRAPDIYHYRMARQLGRTLVTLDHDYVDDRRFPPNDAARRSRAVPRPERAVASHRRPQAGMAYRRCLRG
jgi:hypothetical protein